MNKILVLLSLCVILIGYIYIDFINKFYDNNKYYDYGLCSISTVGCLAMNILKFLDMLIVLSIRILKDMALSVKMVRNTVKSL